MIQKKKIIFAGLILGALILTLIPAGVSADVQVTWVDDSILGSQSFLVKAANGSVLGSYNTSSDVITLQDNSTYIFQLRPIRTNYLENPYALIDSVINYGQDNALGLIFIGFCLYVLLRAGGR